jgi:phosphonate degradation associated HDIG domain protein
MTTADHVIAQLFGRFDRFGAQAYLGEPVSQLEHALQAATLADEDGASAALVAAALLHDVGHLADEELDDPAARGVDGRHEELARRFLGAYFGPETTEPIRLHVAAKRYLCAVQPAYAEQLSPASIRSLELQGGPFTFGEVEEFEQSPYAIDAVRLRRYDDAAKVPGLVTPELEHFRPFLEAALRLPIDA